MASENPVYRWLHLSDLHVGCKGEAVWWQMLEDFQRSLDIWLPKVGGPPDLLLLTGDLAWSGKASEYDRLDRFLERLLGAIEKQTGARPLLIPVAGNHDLERPTGARMSSFRVLDAYEASALDEDVAALRVQLWEKHKPGLLAKPFTHYERWLKRTVIPQLTDKPGVAVHRSFFPGDLTVTADLPGRFPLAVVGLNSAWSHYKGGDFIGRLLLPAEQFQAALPAVVGGSRLDLFQRVERALLLMHHPRSWFTPASRATFDGNVYPGHRFTACLFGHMHEPNAVHYAQAGGAARCFYQAPSLFGLDKYGTKEESRMFGYTFGQVARDGEVRLWPLRSTLRGDGVWTFGPDPDFHWPPELGNGIVLRPGDPQPLPARTSDARTKKNAPALDLAPYCEAVHDATRHIRLDGIAAAAKALNYPIERLYTRLLTNAQYKDVDYEHGGLVDLADLLQSHHRLLIEGQPGSGKTTFLRFAANVLARDFLEEPCPEGPSWRAVHLGRAIARTLPVFLKLSSLATSSKDTQRGGARLLEHLAAETAPRIGDTTESPRARREAWDQHLRDGEVTLLLDGLDEVADPALRDQVFAALEDILRAWPKCRVVVTSRPIAVEPLTTLGFAYASVAPFGENEVRAYVERWVHAYFETDPDKAKGLTEEAYSHGLLDALRARQELRRLASAPVMLTCLCVVYSHGGGLPEGRAELYRDTIRWLLAARESVRKEKGYGGVRVQEALSVLAMAMMGGTGEPKRREFGFKDAAAKVDEVVRGPSFDFDDPASRSTALCAWLRFECEYSGVIEEVGHGQFQFKHLTFQEYLAAAQLAATPNRDWWKIVKSRLEDLQWRETIELFPGCLLDRERGATSDADHLVKEIHALWPKHTPLLRAAKITAITGRFLPAFRCTKYELPRELAQRDMALRIEAEALFTEDGAAKLEEKLRIVAAEAIGVAGDRRIAPEHFETNLLPVPGTRVRLGKYLVTVEEFARFVEDGGYRREKFWIDEDGASFRKRNGWKKPDSWDKQLQTLNRPISEVSWFEAMAYCRWLSAEHPHLRLRLPTEAEWMAAASPDGRRYPWGYFPAPDALRANFGERVNAPTPVGLYPAGNGKFGHCDLAGNIFEWNLDLDNDVGFTTKEVQDHGRPRLIFGGAYWSPDVAAADRRGLGPDHRRGGRGFRVAAEPASR